jgi:hypothetical protein
MTKYAWLAAISALSFVSFGGPARAADTAIPDCYKCDAPKRYDSQEVVKTSRDIDHSRVIDSASYEGKPARVRSDVTLVNFIVHRYRVIEATELSPASEALPRPRRSCRHGRHGGRYDGCGPLRVRG